MESIRREGECAARRSLRHLPLRSFFLLVVFTVFGVVVLLSALAIWGCVAFQNYLLPDPDAAYLTIQEVRADGSVSEMTTWVDFGEAKKIPVLVKKENVDLKQEGVGELDASWPDDLYTMQEAERRELVDATYTVQRIQKSFDTLTPKRKLAYRFCSVAIVAVPAVLSICGILFAGFFFYKKRLAKPLAILAEATDQIAAQNLDFFIEYPCGDEMGKLCSSFERMRQELAQNNKKLWRLLDQRRLMQASIAHDLRNPIAIIEGYTEYLQMHLPAGDLSPAKTERIVNNLGLAAKRLEQYTESVRALNRLEEMEAVRQEIPARELLEEIRDDLQVMADRGGKCLRMGDSWPEGNFSVDREMLFRILENVFENATRFAASQVSVDLAWKESQLLITVTDDGAGFSEEILTRRKNSFLSAGQKEGHLGMGLAISRVLCEKLGGSLTLGNKSPHGAEVKIFLET